MLEWSDSVPVEPGYYWRSAVSPNGSRFMHGVVHVGEEGVARLDDGWPYEWAGPIPPPRDHEGGSDA